MANTYISLNPSAVTSSDTVNITGDVTGTTAASAISSLAVSKLAAGTSAQVLLNSATPTPTWATLSGDLTTSATGVITITQVQAGELTFGSSTGTINAVIGATAPGLTQTIPSTDIIPNNMTIAAQSAELAASTHKTGANLILSSGAGATTTGIGGAIVLLPGTGTSVNGNISLFQSAGSFGSGGGVIFAANAGTVPTANPSGGNLIYSTGGALTSRGSTGGITTVGAIGSAGTINSQAQIYDYQFGTCETISSATPTTILTYTTISGKGGIMTLFISSRATTVGAGVVVGNTGCATYTLTWQNIGGTVTLSTAGITLVGASQTTNTTFVAPTLTTSVATNVITIKVTNVALCTVDSQLVADIIVC
jgi:hypothetical protein